MLKSQLFRVSERDVPQANDAVKEAVLKSGLLEVMKAKKAEAKAKK